MIPPFRVFFTLHFALLLQLGFIFVRRNNRRFRFHFPQLFGTYEADAATRHIRAQNPGDVFHFALACQSPVFVKRAFTHRKTDLPLQIEVSAKHFFLCCSEALDQVSVAAGLAQSLAALRRSSSDLNRDHDVLFSKKRYALRNGFALKKTRELRSRKFSKKFARNAADFTAHQK